MRWYQTIKLDGVDAVYEDTQRAKSKFWDKGKWDNFIEPLLPEHRGTFIEIGCNAGLMLKLAKDVGFRDVIGIDSSKTRVKQANLYKNHNKYDYKILHKEVGRDFDIKELPLADVVLIANTHYYLKLCDLIELLDQLKGRTRYCIVVSAKAHFLGDRARHFLDYIRGCFKDWPEVKLIEGLDIADDPAPRKEMYGVLFKGNLEAYPIEADDKEIDKNDTSVYVAIRELTRMVFNNEKFKIEDTMLYKYFKRTGPKWMAEGLMPHMERKIDLIKDVQKNGLRQPIFFKKDLIKLYDGVHRYIMAQELGHKHILIRRI